MKIAYVVDEDVAVESGVGTKILGQIDAWRAMGHEVRVYSLRPQQQTALEGLTCLSAQSGRLSIDRFIDRIYAVRRLQRALLDYHPTVVYSRFLLWQPGLVRALKPWGAPYVLEINTDDVQELQVKREFAYSIYDRLTRFHLLGRASGLVAVTPALATNSRFAGFGRPLLVLPNGIEYGRFANYVRRSAVPGTPPQVGFVGTPGMPWQGVDRLFDLARLCPDWQLHLVGYSERDLEREGVQYGDVANVHIYGRMTQTACASVLAGCDLAISTLALYRRQVDEACTLKSRQYMAQGLPVIMCYEDPDITCLQLPFVLQLPNTETSLEENLSLIRRFAQNSREIPARLVIDSTRPFLDVAAKERRRIAFMSQTCYGGTSWDSRAQSSM
jgi:hypothetical protein